MNIHPLYAINPERRAYLAQFYAEQARFYMDQMNAPHGGAAALHIAVTGVDQVDTKMAAVDPAHAAVMLGELDRVRAQLLQYIEEHEPALFEHFAGKQTDQRSNVVALRR